MIRIILVGAAGRMGRSIADVVCTCSDMTITAGIETPGHDSIGTPCGDGVVADNLKMLISKADVVVDFSAPEGIEQRLASTIMESKPYITGITGLRDDAAQALKDAGQSIPVVTAPNFSIGINVLYHLVAEAARLLGPGFDAEICEVHHRAKRDAPSGTARALLDVLRSGGSVESVTFGRNGVTGPKTHREVGVHSIRTGDVVGEHIVTFGGPGERLELAHRVSSRETFAVGVLAAVRFVVGRQPGCYSMVDVLESAPASD